MKLLTKNTDYAIRALVVLAMNEGLYVSSRVIADKQSMPYQFLRTILQELIKHKIIVSKEGVGGGVTLAKDPAKIKIVDVIRIFQGDVELSQCMFRKKMCKNRPTCVLRREIKKIEKLVEREFGKLTIKGLINKMSNNKKGEQ